MAYISQITLPSGTTYDIKDAWARTQIEAITGGSAIVFKGVTTTALTDGGNENPTVGGSQITTKATGDLYFYNKEQFIYGDDNKWHSLGPQLQTLGALAYKDNASGSYTPAGTISGGTFTGTTSTFSGSFTPSGNVSLTNSNVTATVSAAASGDATYTPAGNVSAPTISVATAGTTTTIKNPTKNTVATAVTAVAPGGTAPSNNLTYYNVTGENLSLYQLGYNTGDSITTTDVTVKTGDASYSATQPSFTGTGARLVTGNISVPSSADFTGTSGSVSVSGTPNGGVSNIEFTGTAATITVS